MATSRNPHYMYIHSHLHTHTHTNKDKNSRQKFPVLQSFSRFAIAVHIPMIFLEVSCGLPTLKKEHFQIRETERQSK